MNSSNYEDEVIWGNAASRCAIEQCAHLMSGCNFRLKLAAFAEALLGTPYESNCSSALPPSTLRTTGLSCTSFICAALAFATSTDIAHAQRTYRKLRTVEEMDGCDKHRVQEPRSLIDALFVSSIGRSVVADVTASFEPWFKIDACTVKTRLLGASCGFDNRGYTPATPRGLVLHLLKAGTEAQWSEAVWQPGDIAILFRRESDGRYSFCHSAIVMDNSGGNFIHATPHYYKPDDSPRITKNTGIYYTDTPKREMLGVSYGYMQDCERSFFRHKKSILLCYDVSRLRSLQNYATENFDAIAVARCR